MDARELWATKYAQLWSEERAKEEARREQAFLDLPITVCGEPLRAMTPYDLLLLNGAESPFVCPTEIEPGHVALFFWLLHAENDHSDGWRNRRRKRALIRRLAPKAFDEVVKGAREYVEEIFQDAPQGGGGAGHEERRPLGTCFIAPLVIGIALETGWTQHDILGTPLPRLFQYKKAIARREQGRDFVDTSPSDRFTGEFLSELNALNSAN